MQYCFHLLSLKSKDNRPLRSVFCTIWISYKILTKKSVTFIIWEKKHTDNTFLKEKKVETFKITTTFLKYIKISRSNKVLSRVLEPSGKEKESKYYPQGPKQFYKQCNNK